MGSADFRRAWIALALVFAAYGFAQLLPLTYPRLLALLSGVEQARVFRVLGADAAQLREKDQTERVALSTLKEKLSAARGNLTAVETELEIRRSTPGRSNECKEAESATGAARLACWSEADLKGSLNESEGRVRELVTEIKKKEADLENLQADLDALNALGRVKTDNDVRNIGLMIVAAAAGLLGASLRVLISLPTDYDAGRFDRTPGAYTSRELRRKACLVIGPLLGVAVFWLLDSKFLIPLLYSGGISLESVQQVQVTLQGVAISAAVAGLVGLELLGRVTDRFVNSEPVRPSNGAPPQQPPPEEPQPEAPRGH